MATYCPNCLKFVNEADPVSCPYCGQTFKNHKIRTNPIYKRWWFWLIVLLAIAFAIMPKSNTSIIIEYKVMAESYVESALKAPSTAEYCSVDSCTVKVYEDIVYVTGYVDSQNGFGAKVRSYYEVEMLVKKPNYKLIYMKIGDNEFGEYISMPFTILR